MAIQGTGKETGYGTGVINSVVQDKNLQVVNIAGAKEREKARETGKGQIRESQVKTVSSSMLFLPVITLLFPLSGLRF